MANKNTEYAEKEVRLIYVFSGLFILAVIGLLVYNGPDLVDYLNKVENVATVVSVKGEPLKKPAYGYKLSSIAVDDLIMNADEIFTDKDSQIEISFSSGSTILIHENSQVVLSALPKNISLLIEKGGISGYPATTDLIEVSSKKETYYLSESDEGKFFAKLSGNNQIDIKSVEGSLRIENQLQDDNRKIAEDFSLPKNLKVVPGRPELFSNVRGPYPKPMHYFLHQKGGVIPMVAERKCQGRCQVNLFFNDKIVLNKFFERNETPQLALQFDSQFEGQLSWQVLDGSLSAKSVFSIKHNNSANAKEAISGNHPVDVIK